MPKVKALVYFEHHGRRDAGDIFEVSDKHAAALEVKRLVTLDVAADLTAALPATRRRVQKQARVPAANAVTAGQSDVAAQQLSNDQAQASQESSPPASAPAADVADATPDSEA